MDMNVGSRLTSLRRRRGLSQERLAEVAGISVGVVKKLENGGTARIESYHKLAQALRVHTVWFMEPSKSHPPKNDPSEKAEQIELTRHAFRLSLLPDFWSSITRSIQDEDLNIDAALRVAAELDSAYLATRYDEVAVCGPEVLNTLRLHQKVAGGRSRELGTALALAYDAVGRYLSQVNCYDLAWIAVSNGINQALAIGDQELISQLRSGQALVLVRLGNFVEVEDTCSRLADQLEPKISDATETQIAIWGRMLHWAAAAAARNNRPKEALEYISLSKVASSRLRHEIQGHTTFGPISTAAQEVEVLLLSDRPDEALSVSIGESLQQINTAKRNHFLLDRAMAAHRVGDRNLVTNTLEEIQRDSPEWIIHSSRPRKVVREIISEWHTLLPKSTRRLADLIEVPLGDKV